MGGTIGAATRPFTKTQEKGRTAPPSENKESEMTVRWNLYPARREVNAQQKYIQIGKEIAL